MDQEGQPISDARVFIRIDNEYFGPGSTSEVFSNQEGLFSVTGAKGAGLYVSASKAGYLEQTSSSKKMSFVSAPQMTSSSNPEKLILVRINDLPEMLIQEAKIKLPKNGGIKNYEIQGLGAEILFSLKQNKTESDMIRGWPWQFSIKMVAGGFLERKKSSNQIAPEKGYRETVSVDMTQDSGGVQWQKVHFQSYFINVLGQSEKYGIMDIKLFAETGLLMVETRVNLDGSTNIPY